MSSSVLICDDSNLARKQVIRSLPSQWDVDVQLAKNGLEALSVLRTANIDVMFLDLTMPELDGVGVLEALQQENISLPVFVISADIQPEMQNKVLELGAKAFLRKPINADTLTSTLQDFGIL
ncbi:response regulator [Thalassotalea euphylliae]|uniref:Response regulator n=1 Tax=Thalassotalea euphylliae TaxID=1655234 RepID=A0A3E0UCW6_9GAMM|nr:response regulator [Thalassotalea euphylliae]REL34564.1 response regulator [Thalassotalea euphylliae]